MGSTFSWLDHSDTERRRVLEAIDRFKETETRDELGLGSIRDAFADLFFPGTSVLQTRARYFLFVPWLYLALEARGTRSAEIDVQARKAETKLIAVLKASEDAAGTIGRRAGETLKRLPSSVYWLGLHRWRIRILDASQEDYHRSLDRFYTLRGSSQRDNDGELLDGRPRRNWHAGLPPPPDDFPGNASLTLERHEARYLVDRIQMAAPRSLLAFLARRGRPADVNFAWEHPQLGEMPAEVQTAIAHARLLAETMHGAAWLYNILLAEERAKTTGQMDHVEQFRTRIGEWAAEVGARGDAIAAWDRPSFWKLVRMNGNVSRTTESFVENWLRLAPWEKGDGGADNKAARELVRHREQQLKGGRSRLTNARALELWGGESGTGRIEYRFRAATRLVADMHQALGRGENDAEAE